MCWLQKISLCFLAFKLVLSNCPVSRETVTYVSNCPKSEEEWRLRAEFKRCSHVRQNCTSPENFVYHCVINNFANATMEVCAPHTAIIAHRCAQFNIKAAKIIESQPEENCKGFCPFKYNSTEAYKYQVCYVMKCQICVCNTTIPNGYTDFNSSSPTKTEDTCLNSTLPILVSLSILLSVFIFLFIYKCIQMKKKPGGIEQKHRAYVYIPAPKNEDDEKSKKLSEEKNAKRIKDDPFIIAIDIGEKYFGLAHTDPNNPQKVKPSHPMERIAVLIEKPDKIKAVGRNATNDFIDMKDDELLNYVYINEIKHDELDKKIPGTNFLNIDLFTTATLDVMNRIEKEISKRMKDMQDVRIVFSAGCHWRGHIKLLIANILENGNLLNWEKGKEKVAFIEKVETISQFIREAQAASYCLNFNVDNLKIESNTGYAVLNVGFGSCHLTFLQGREEGHLDTRGSGGTTRKDWKEALPEDQVWSLCQKMIDEKYFNQQNYVRVIYQYENFHERIRICRDDKSTFHFSFPKHIFKTNFKKMAEMKGIEIDEKENSIILCFKWSLLKTCFTRLRESVKEEIEKNKEDFRKYNVKCVFIIGGYNIMELIQDAAKNDWFENVTLVIPDDAGVCYAVGGATAGARRCLPFNATRIKGYQHRN